MSAAIPAATDLPHSAIAAPLRRAFSQVAKGVDSAYHAVSSGLNALWDHVAQTASSAWRELRLIETGALHLDAASENTKAAFRRDATTCAVETSLAIAQDVALEATVAIAAIETAEKIVNHNGEKIKPGVLAAEFAESVTSSAAAAIHAGAAVVCDLEISGMEWEAKHPCPPHAAVDLKPKA